MFNRTFAAIAAALMLALAAPPASALELPNDSAGRVQAQTLTAVEAREWTALFLGDYLGPTVADTRARPVVEIWRCEVAADRGWCRGMVTAGNVSCRGTFRVRETRSSFWVFPLRSVCGVAKRR